MLRLKLPSLDTSSKIAISALVVSICSMVGTVGNFLLNARWQQAQQQTRISFRCEIPHDSVTELRPSDFSLAFGREGGIGDPGPDLVNHPTDYATFPLMIVIKVECRVANLGAQKVSISRLYPAVAFGYVTIIDKDWLAEMIDEKGIQAVLPRLLDQGEEIVYTLDVNWPVEATLAYALKSFYERRSSRDYFHLSYQFAELRESGGLANAFAWQQKRLHVLLETTGERYEQILHPSF